MHHNNELPENVSLIFADGFGGTFGEEMKNRYAIEVKIPNIEAKAP
jgi:hypothetical protein